MPHRKNPGLTPNESASAGKAGRSSEFDFALRREALLMLKHKAGIIIDPNAASRSALRAMLGAIGMTQVVQVAGSVDALRRVREHATDIILCDYMLEDGRDGQQLLEEMRSKRLIPLSTAFIVITRERRYQAVISVAELAPDDYLLKPFTPQHLMERLESVLAKKHVFRHAHRHVEASEADAALTACDAICVKYPHYRLDALRLKAETLMACRRTEEAEALYRQILAHKAVPWAKMGLALAARESGHLDEAADLVLDVVQSHPQYLAAYDLAATIDEQRGRSDEAQQHLQAAVDHAPHGLNRQRQLGRLALENGDFAAAEAAMAVVISRGSGSSLRELGDYAQLARIQVAAGKPEAALETVAAMSRDMRGHANASMLGEAMAALAHAKMGNAEQATLAANQAKKRAAAGGDMQPDLLVDVSQALFVAGDAAGGEQILLRAISLGEGDERFGKYMNRVMATFQETAGVADNLSEDLRQRFIQINNEGVRLGKAGDFDQAIGLFREAAAQLPSLQMFANAAKAILAKLNRDGWNDELAAEAIEYLKRGKSKAPTDARILSAIAAFGQVATKFGIRQSDTAWD